MRERPILFSGPMVRALLDGRKTQTRRAIKGVDMRKAGGWLASGLSPAFVAEPGNGLSPYGYAGDQLWVREAHAYPNDQITLYRANWREDAKARGFDNIPADDRGIRWRPSIHMRRADSRITLRVTDVRVERLNEISEADLLAEGIEHRKVDHGYPGADLQDAYFFGGGNDDGYGSARHAYRDLWTRINGPGSWDANPWVWCVAFEVVR